jgi:hypothetical protein
VIAVQKNVFFMLPACQSPLFFVLNLFDLAAPRPRRPARHGVDSARHMRLIAKPGLQSHLREHFAPEDRQSERGSGAVPGAKPGRSESKHFIEAARNGRIRQPMLSRPFVDPKM